MCLVAGLNVASHVPMSGGCWAGPNGSELNWSRPFPTIRRRILFLRREPDLRFHLAAWGGEGDDVFVTVDGGKGHVKIMDFEYGDTIEFCGCASTVIEMRGNDAWIMKGEDVKAVVKGVDADSLNLDFVNRVITMVSDPMA